VFGNKKTKGYKQGNQHQLRLRMYEGGEPWFYQLRLCMYEGGEPWFYQLRLRMYEGGEPWFLIINMI
jgi:hypothetical protein